MEFIHGVEQVEPNIGCYLDMTTESMFKERIGLEEAEAFVEQAYRNIAIREPERCPRSSFYHCNSDVAR